MTDEEIASDLTLRDVLDAAAEDLADVRGAADGDAVTWAVGDTVFAALDAGRSEFRLDPLVARAALRTPDTAPSTRGPDWVAFAPETLDDGAVDRAEAWFLSAYRRAGRHARPGSGAH
jgi:hypothetical protein